MTPDELIASLQSLRIFTSRRTLLRYEHNSLITPPERGNLGRAEGRYTNYPKNAPNEYYASYCTIKFGTNPKQVAKAREEAITFLTTKQTPSRINQTLATHEDQTLSHIILQWLNFYHESQNNEKTPSNT